MRIAPWMEDATSAQGKCAEEQHDNNNC